MKAPPTQDAPTPGPEELSRWFGHWEPAPAPPDVASTYVHATPRRVRGYRRRILRCLVEAVGPSVDQLVIRPDDVIADIEATLPYFQPMARFGYRLVLILLELGVVLLGGSWRPFSFMPLEGRRRLLERWLVGRSIVRRDLARVACLPVRMMGYARTELWAPIGYDPVPWFADRRARRKELLDDFRPSVD